MKKSERNRTITIEENEIKDLENSLSKTYDGVINKIYNCDFFEIIDKIPNKSFNLIIIDPPYNLSKDFGTVLFKSGTDEYYENYLETWLGTVCDKLKDNGSLYICCDWKCSHIIQKVLSKYLTIINRITWGRDKGRGSKNNWKNNHEDIFFAVKNPKDYVFNLDDVKVKKKVIAPYRDKEGNNKDWYYDENGEKYRMTHPSNFWSDIVVPFWSMAENTEHPTQKSEKLISRLILASSNEGDIVFDPFMGSGTTLVTANKLNRLYCGIEIDKKYCLVTVKRLINSENNKRIQGLD